MDHTRGIRDTLEIDPITPEDGWTSALWGLVRLDAESGIPWKSIQLHLRMGGTWALWRLVGLDETGANG